MRITALHDPIRAVPEVHRRQSCIPSGDAQATKVSRLGRPSDTLLAMSLAIETDDRWIDRRRNRRAYASLSGSSLQLGSARVTSGNPDIGTIGDLTEIDDGGVRCC